MLKPTTTSQRGSIPGKDVTNMQILHVDFEQGGIQDQPSGRSWEQNISTTGITNISMLHLVAR